MSRRRRQRNPLIMRILGITVLAHIIILPILAHFGAFKGIKHDLTRVSLMSLPPPAQKAPPPPKKKVVKKAKKKPVSHKSVGKHVTAHHFQQKNLTQPKVVAGKGSGNGGSITNNGTAAAGQVPTQVAPKTIAPVTKAAGPPPVVQQKPPPPVVVPKKQQQQIAQVPTAPVVPLAPVIVAAVPALALSAEPQPEIPRDLRDEAFDKTCIVEVNVSSDGTPTDAVILQSCGIDRLDRRAVEAAKKWKFIPATSNGTPIASIVRLHIAFEVN